MLLGGRGQNHNGFKLDLASEYGISRSQLAWIIASNNDYMIIKERTTGHKKSDENMFYMTTKKHEYLTKTWQ